jgi:hypothetical protein
MKLETLITANHTSTQINSGIHMVATANPTATAAPQ